MAKLCSLILPKKKNEKCVPIDELLEDNDVPLPCVVDLETNEENTRMFGLTDKTEAQLYIEKTVKLEFVRVEVMDIAARTDNGYTDMRTGRLRQHLIGQELLIPLTYSGVLSLVNKSFRKKVYNTIDEIPDPSPSTLTLNQPCHLQSSDNQLSPLLPAGTRLRVKRVVRHGSQHVILKNADDTSYIAGQDDLQHFSFLPTRQPLPLKDFVSYFQLPKLALFNVLTRYNSIFFDDATFHALAAALSGPVKVKEVEEFSCHVAWLLSPHNQTRNHANGNTWPTENDDVTRALFLIPENHSQEIKVRKKIVRTHANTTENCNFEHFVSSKLYTKDVNQQAVTRVGHLLLKVENLSFMSGADQLNDKPAEPPTVPQAESRLNPPVTDDDDELDHDYVNFPSISRRRLITSLAFSQLAEKARAEVNEKRDKENTFQRSETLDR